MQTRRYGGRAWLRNYNPIWSRSMGPGSLKKALTQSMRSGQNPIWGAAGLSKGWKGALTISRNYSRQPTRAVNSTRLWTSSKKKSSLFCSWRSHKWLQLVNIARHSNTPNLYPEDNSKGNGLGTKLREKDWVPILCPARDRFKVGLEGTLECSIARGSLQT